MKAVNNEKTVFFDVDDTLVIEATGDIDHKHIKIQDPIENKILEMRVHEPMVRLLKEERHRGSYVVVWSRGGYEWASNVVKALNLEYYVDLVMSKPLVYFDDKDISEWLPYRVYLDPNMKYKK